jgi:hypothetical protein
MKQRIVLVMAPGKAGKRSSKRYTISAAVHQHCCAAEAQRQGAIGVPAVERVMARPAAAVGARTDGGAPLEAGQEALLAFSAFARHGYYPLRSNRTLSSGLGTTIPIARKCELRLGRNPTPRRYFAPVSSQATQPHQAKALTGKWRKSVEIFALSVIS